MRCLLTDTVVVHDGRAVAGGEVVMAALYWGDWLPWQRGLAEAIALVGSAHDAGETLSEPDLHAALVTWRRERRLLSAQDYRGWLADRDLSPAQVAGHLERRLLYERSRQRGAGPPGQVTGPDEIERALIPAAILSGRLRAWAQRLVRSCAAARGLAAAGEPRPHAREREVSVLASEALQVPLAGLGTLPVAVRRRWAARVIELEQAWSSFVALVAGRTRIERCLAAHGLDWQRMSWDEATFAREDAAREAALWVREDGMTLRQIAERAGMQCVRESAYGADRPELAGMLVGAAVGEVFGPLTATEGWRLVQLRARVARSAQDAELEARAREEVLEDALARHLAGRVEWHGHL